MSHRSAKQWWWEYLPLMKTLCHGSCFYSSHDGVSKWKHFPHFSPLMRGIHRSPVNSPHKDQWHGALMCSLIWINSWVNSRKAGDLRRHRAHYDVNVMLVLRESKPPVTGRPYPHRVGIMKIWWRQCYGWKWLCSVTFSGRSQNVQPSDVIVPSGASLQTYFICGQGMQKALQFSLFCN